MANVCPWESLMWTMSKDPGCRSLLTTVPTRPKLRPPVIMHRLPTVVERIGKNVNTQVR